MLEAWVYESDGTTLIARVMDAVDVTALEELEAFGGGSLTIKDDNAALVAHPTLLAYRNVVKVRFENTFVAAWLIKTKVQAVVDGVITVSGPGLLGWFEDAVLYSEFHAPYSAGTRWFNWGSKQGSWYDAKEWGSPHKLWKRGGEDFTDRRNPFRRKPRHWPKTGARKSWWIWDRRHADKTAPRGYVYFRRHLTVDEDGTDFTLYATANNKLRVLVDGEPLMNIKQRKAYKRTYEVDVTLDAGLHVFAFRAYNRASFAGFICALMRSPVDDEDEDDDGTLEFRSGGGDGWHVLGYPDSAPGWTPGEVVSTIMAEADDRGVPPFAVLGKGFTHTVDSDSVAWNARQWSFDVGATYWDVLDSMRQSHGVNVRVDPASLDVELYKVRGVDRSASVVATVASQVTNLEEQIEAALANTLLIAADDQWDSAEDASSVAAYGRIEAYVDLSQMSSASAATVATKILAQNAIPIEGITVSFDPTSQTTPWRDFQVGDWIGVSTAGGGHTARKVVSISVAMNRETGSPEWTVELDAVTKDQLDRLQRIIDADRTKLGTMGGRSPGSGKGGSGGRSPDGNDGGVPSGGPSYRSPAVSTSPDDDPWVPPDDDEPRGLDVGDVSKDVATDMIGTWITYGASLKLALCTGEPTLTDGVWSDVAAVELSGSGYARATVPFSGLSAPEGNDPVVRSTIDTVVFPANSGSDDWATVICVAVLDAAGTDILSVTPLADPIVVKPNETAVIAGGNFQLVVSSA